MSAMTVAVTAVARYGAVGFYLAVISADAVPLVAEEAVADVHTSVS